MVYKKTAEEALSELKTRESGLTAAEAEASRNEHGPNVIPQGRRKTVPEVFISQFADLLVLILIASAAISFATGNADSAIVILCVITLNAVLGTYQHFKAERSLESLKKLSAPSARVRRDGKVVEIPASEVVVGDILLLEYQPSAEDRHHAGRLLDQRHHGYAAVRHTVSHEQRPVADDEEHRHDPYPVILKHVLPVETDFPDQHV